MYCAEKMNITQTTKRSCCYWRPVYDKCSISYYRRNICDAFYKWKNLSKRIYTCFLMLLWN